MVDNRPDLRGVNACERLTEADIPCSYVYINSATYVMKDQVSRLYRILFKYVIGIKIDLFLDSCLKLVLNLMQIL